MEQPDHTWQLPTAHIGRRVMVFGALPSTNDFAAKYAASLESGTVVLAREQSAGRGNFGRTWLSPAGGGVWMSIVLRPSEELMPPVVAIAWVGVSVAETIRRHVNQQPALKWPNDVLLRGRKVAGILIEQSEAMVVGIGLNVNQTAMQLLTDGLPTATSMAIIAGHDFDIDAVARDLIQQLDSEYTSLLGGEVATLESCWKWRMGLLGRNVVVETLQGGPIVGRLLEMSFAGLTVETRSGVERISPDMTKHVSLRPESGPRVT